MSADSMRMAAAAASIAALIGGWRLLCWEITYDDKRPPRLPFGPDPQGRLLYTADGRMLAAIARADRRRLPADNPRAATDADKREAFDGFFCYGGRYEIHGDQVIHHVEIALNPNLAGTRQIRQIRFDGEDLQLTGSDTEPDSGVVRHHRLLWARR